MNTKELIEELHKRSLAGADKTLARAADTLERLTQPVEVEPVAWRLKHKEHQVGITSYDLDQMESYIADGWEIVGCIYSAETVARLQAERDDALNEAKHNGEQHRLWFAECNAVTKERDALQEQVKMLREALEKICVSVCYTEERTFGNRMGDINEVAKEALAANKPYQSLKPANADDRAIYQHIADNYNATEPKEN